MSTWPNNPNPLPPPGQPMPPKTYPCVEAPVEAPTLEPEEPKEDEAAQERGPIEQMIDEDQSALNYFAEQIVLVEAALTVLKCAHAAIQETIDQNRAALAETKG